MRPAREARSLRIPMRRLAFLLALFCLPGAVRSAENAVARIDAEYRAKRQAALSAQWMDVKLPIETPAEFLSRVLDAAREGDSRATAALGWRYQEQGDLVRARTWLTRAAESGNLFAQHVLGLLKKPDGAPAEDPATAVDWLRRAADGGLPESQFEVALRYAQGKGAPLDPATAREWYGRAAAQRYAPALCNLGTMELQGTGGAVDLKSAEAHFRTAGEAGFPQGHYGVAEVLRLQNKLADAIAPYQRAAEAGIAEADFWLGCFASQGLGRPRDEKTAAQHFLKAALGGHLVSEAIAADVLRQGAGVPPDPEGAKRWDAEVEKFENADVVATVGSLYVEGRLVRRDPARALHFLRKAAERGQAAAQRLAGTLLATGEAGERDLGEAYQWLWLASRNGQADAEPAFRAVLNAMSGEEILQAAKRAERFHPRAE